MLSASSPFTVRGGGYSYAPASLGLNTLHLDMRAWRSVLDFDRETGLIEVEAGITLGQVHHVATPAGWHLPSQPGYPEITIGGCIGGDVHGKNQHVAGNFRNCVRSIRLWHPDHGVQELSAGDPVFDLTMGGLGLTGVILSAVLQLDRLLSPVVLVSTSPIDDAQSTPSALGGGSASLFSYTWQNFTRRRNAGRGVAYSAVYDVAEPSSPSASARYTPLDAQHRGWPIRAMYRPTIVAMNNLYEWSVRVGKSTHRAQMIDFLFPAARKATYFKMFGHAGFHEAQILVSEARAPSFLGAVAELARSSHAPVTLASCKLFSGTSQFIRFDGTGVVLAVDAPRDTRGTKFITEVHRLMLEHEGRPNLLKDSLLDVQTIETSVRGVDDFRKAIRAYDPARRFRSVLSDRLEF